MRKLIFPFFLLILGCSSCDSDCTNLREKDEKILAKFRQLQGNVGSSLNDRYLVKLKVLYDKEQALLRQVRHCDLQDPEAFNYWYGERLKYPSDLERTYIKMTEKP